MSVSEQTAATSRAEDFGLLTERELMRRVAIALLLLGALLEVVYSAFFHAPDWTDGVAVVLVGLALAWVLALDWDSMNPRMIVPPVLLGVAALTVFVIGDQVAVGMTFLFLPAAIVMVFYWEDLLVKLAVMVPLSVLYLAVPAVWGDKDAMVEAVTTLPLLLASSIILGAVFNRFRHASVEQGRFRGTITALLIALDARDGHTSEHASEVLALVTDVGQRLGLDQREQLHVADVALLHDVGKIGVPSEILDKPTALSEREWRVVRRHPEIGQRILSEVPGFENVAADVRHEHERWDGGGYPDGLSGETIPLTSRIVFACDAYQAMISERPYRTALKPEEARRQLQLHAGTQFDPEVVDALLAALAAQPQVQDRGLSEHWHDALADEAGGEAASL